MIDRIGDKPAPDRLKIVQAFINTATSGREDFVNPECLRDWLRDHDLIDAAAHLSAADVRQAVSVRNALSTLAAQHGANHTRRGLRKPSAALAEGAVADPDAIETLNRAARSAQMSVSFGKQGRARIESLAPAVDGALGKIIAIVVDAMSDGSWERLKICRDDICAWAFYDRSKNRSGAWCDITDCGNIAKARAFRARHAHDASR